MLYLFKLNHRLSLLQSPNSDVCVWVGGCYQFSVHSWTAAKNDIFKGLSFKPMGFLRLVSIDLQLDHFYPI